MTIRAALPDEASAVYEVISQGRARLAALDIDQWQGGRPDLALIRSDIAAGCCRIAMEEGRIAATMALFTNGEPSYDQLAGGKWLTTSHSSRPTYACVHRVAVADRALGRGFAKRMLLFAEEEARERGRVSVRIDTHPRNVPMRALLARCGYEECGLILLDESFGEPTRERIALEKLVAR